MLVVLKYELEEWRCRARGWEAERLDNNKIKTRTDFKNLECVDTVWEIEDSELPFFILLFSVTIYVPGTTVGTWERKTNKLYIWKR